MHLPTMYLCRQEFPKVRIEDPCQHVRDALRSSWIPEQVKAGHSVAITGGSRGIAAIVPVMRTLAEFLKDLGARPFIINAMGSHGGATAEGQKEVLAALGITEESVGCPVITTMEVVQVGELEDGFPLLVDKNAWEADHIVVVNRVKLHTALRGPVQSGLCKMLTVGLGKERQAANLHRYGPVEMGSIIPRAARAIIERTKVLAGIAIVENAYGEPAVIELVRPEEIPEADARLLKVSSDLHPHLPLDDIDLLIVEEMGKCYSGAGMDPYVIGRWRIWGEPELEKPRTKRIVTLRLAPASHGNAQGVGLADFITRRLFESIDLAVTYKNTLTSTFVQRGMIPIICANDREAIENAIYSLPQVREDELKIVWIKNTLHLEVLGLSGPALEAAHHPERLKIIKEWAWEFDEEGNLRFLESDV